MAPLHLKYGSCLLEAFQNWGIFKHPVLAPPDFVFPGSVFHNFDLQFLFCSLLQILTLHYKAANNIKHGCVHMTVQLSYFFETLYSSFILYYEKIRLNFL